MGKKNKKGGGGKLTTEELVNRQQEAQASGNQKQARKLERRLANRAMRNPEQALPIGQQVAQENFQTNLAANRPNQNTIGGSMQYVTDPVTGQVTVNQSLSPEQQALYNQQIAQTSAANSAFMNAFNSGIPYGQAYDFSGAPAAPSTQDLSAERQRIEQGLIKTNTADLDQSYEKQRSRTMDEMAARGNTPGTPAWDKALKDLDENYNQERSRIRDASVAQAGQEFERSFNIGQQGRQSYIGEQVMGRTQPMQELGQMAAWGGGPTTQPNFFGFQPVQYQGPEYLPYLQAGIDQGLGWGAIRKPTGGGGSPAPAPGPSFSIGGAPGAVPNVPNAPDPVAGGFTAGINQGVPIGIAAS